MAISSSVQFVGKSAALDAYSMRAVAAWSMWQGRQFLFKYEGTDLNEGEDYLGKIFEMLCDSPAVYTLKIYEQMPGGKITEKTPCDGSFNFRLNESVKSDLPAISGDNRAMIEMFRELKDENKKLREQIEQMQLIDESDPQPIGAIGVINQVMAIPGVAEIISGLVTRFINPVPTSGTPVSIAGVPPVSDVQEITQQEAERLVNSFIHIRAKMPEALELLEKLADMATNNPKKFDGIAGTMKMFL